VLYRRQLAGEAWWTPPEHSMHEEAL
jgi:hypothetical protein